MCAEIAAHHRRHSACSAAMSRLWTSASTATHIPALISFPTLSGLPKAWLGELPTAPTAFARLHHSHIPVRQRPHCGCGTPPPLHTPSGCLLPVHARVGCRGENEVTPPQQQASTLRPPQDFAPRVGHQICALAKETAEYHG
jgi:hypothetical protein